MKLTNIYNIPLPFAVLLATDNYDFVPKKRAISVTTLIDSPQKWALSKRIPPEDNPLDVSQLVSSSIGSAIHYGLEQVWKNPYKALETLGFSKEVIETIEVYTERRTEKEINGWTVSGSADLILNGHLYDYKTVDIYGYKRQSNLNKFTKQLSIYRWLNQDIVRSDEAFICYYIRDWSAREAKYKQDYPATSMVAKEIQLMSLKDTEDYILDRLSIFGAIEGDLPEDMPPCSPEELWQDKPVWQYFANPTSVKATKNFDTEYQALMYQRTKGKGIVKYRAAKAKRCANYCRAYPICHQAKQLKEMGLIHEP